MNTGNSFAFDRDGDTELPAPVQTLLAQLPLGLLVYNAQGRLLAANTAARQLLGDPCSDTDKEAHSFPALLDSEGLPLRAADNPLLLTLADGQARRNILLGLPPGRSGLHCWVYTATIPLPSGYVALSLQEATHQVIQSYNILNSEERYRLIADHISDTVIRYTPAGAILYLSPAVKSLLGHTPEELQGQPLSRIVAPPDLPLLLRVTGTDGGHCRQTVRLLHRDGSTLWAELSLKLLETPDGSEEIIGLVRDVTEQILFEQHLERHAFDIGAINKVLEERIAEQADAHREQEQLLLRQSRLAVVGEMISSIAHQWRQPLNALGLLLQEIALLAPQQTEIGSLVDLSLGQIDHMSRTITNFRSFLATQPAQTHISLQTEIRQAVELVRPTMEALHIPVLLEMPQQMPLIAAEEGFVVQILLNLLNNAKEAIQAQPLHPAPRIGVTVILEEQTALIRVEDNGPGVEAAVAASLFTPYFSTKKEAQGTGLGLYMSQLIAERKLGGTLRFAGNTPEGGAAFVLTLPIVA